MKLTIFPTRNRLGQELARSVKQRAEGELGFAVEVLDQAGPWDFFTACADSDAVVLDATLEPAEEDRNYSFASPFSIDKLLVVARSHVPLNFGGIHPGGTAKYSDPEGPEGQKTNAKILEWLVPHLREIAQRPRGLGDAVSRFLPSTVRFAVNMGQTFLKPRPRRAEGKVFISYRSQYHSAVAGLASRPAGRGDLFFFDPGEIVYEDEIMTPLRRWQILSMIQDDLIAAKEVWIYRTEDYLDSWWTSGELLSTLEFTKPESLQGKLRLYDPADQSVHTLEAGWLPRLTEQHKKKMARYQANSHPDMMAPESRHRGEQVPDIAWVRKLFLADDPVFSREFWEYHLIPCTSRKPTEPSSPHESLRDFGLRLSRVDIDSFLKLAQEDDFIVPQDQLQRAAAGEESLTCPACGQPIRLSREKPRYLWSPQPDAAQTGGPWGRLVELPVYRASCRNGAVC
jgi:hypothetical protein